MEHGDKRLYFLARDGAPMYEIAKELCKKRNLDIECRYLYVSRYALRIPAYHRMGREAIDYICTDGINITFYKVMKRAALTEQQIKEFAQELGFDKKITTPLSRTELWKLKEQLQSSPYFYRCVREHSQKAWDNAVGYLRQEGLFDEVPSHFVDSGWVGTLQKTLNLLIESQGSKKRIHGYYFGLYETPKGLRNEYEAFYFVPEKEVLRKVYFSNCLFETLCTSTDGMTIAYQKESKTGNYFPVFSSKHCLNEERILQHEQDLKCFVAEYLKQEDGAEKNSFDKTDILSKDILRLCMGNPSNLESRYFGTYLFSDDLLEEDTQQVGVLLSREEIRQHYLFAKIKSKVTSDGLKKDSAWLEGSIVRSLPNGNRQLWKIRGYKYFVAIKKTWKGL